MPVPRVIGGAVTVPTVISFGIPAAKIRRVTDAGVLNAGEDGLDGVIDCARRAPCATCSGTTIVLNC